MSKYLPLATLWPAFNSLAVAGPSGRELNGEFISQALRWKIIPKPAQGQACNAFSEGQGREAWLAHKGRFGWERGFVSRSNARTSTPLRVADSRSLWEPLHDPAVEKPLNPDFA